VPRAALHGVGIRSAGLDPWVLCRRGGVRRILVERLPDPGRVTQLVALVGSGTTGGSCVLPASPSPFSFSQSGPLVDPNSRLYFTNLIPVGAFL
jgi:hypothetical protein